MTDYHMSAQVSSPCIYNDRQSTPMCIPVPPSTNRDEKVDRRSVVRDVSLVHRNRDPRKAAFDFIPFHSDSTMSSGGHPRRSRAL